jgi:exodeoxyribonuclease VII small subunit
MSEKNNVTEPISIEEGFKQLDQIIKNMEVGNQSLEDAFGDYQKGIALVQNLDAALTDMEKRLEVFNKMTGELETQNE